MVSLQGYDFYFLKLFNSSTECFLFSNSKWIAFETSVIRLHALANFKGFFSYLTLVNGPLSWLHNFYTLTKFYFVFPSILEFWEWKCEQYVYTIDTMYIALNATNERIRKKCHLFFEEYSRTPITRTKSNFPGISPHFSVTFNSVNSNSNNSNSPRTRTKFLFPWSKSNWKLPR